MTHNIDKINRLRKELEYWSYFARGGDAGEVATETRRQAKKIIRQANKELAKLVREEASEK